jgi:5-methylcytosine-specific restriction endonuclease McrA
MKAHTKIYLDYFNFKIPKDCGCEICGSPAVDIHHIKSRGMGGSKQADVIENLMAVCRDCHNNYGDVPEIRPKLTEVHLKYMNIYGKS